MLAPAIHRESGHHQGQNNGLAWQADPKAVFQLLGNPEYTIAQYHSVIRCANEKMGRKNYITGYNIGETSVTD